MSRSNSINPWDEIALEWSARLRSGGDLSRNLIIDPTISIALKKYAPKIVLDIGAGDGSFSNNISKEIPCQMVACDLSREMCKQAIELEMLSKTVNCDACALPFSTAVFDAAVGNMLLTSVSDLDKCMKDIARVLKINSHFIFSIFNPSRVIPRNEIETEVGNLPLSSSIVPIVEYTSRRVVLSPLKLGGGPLPLKVPYHHRMMSDYIQALQRANFTVITMYEPIPEEHILAEHPIMTNYWKLAPFLIIDAMRII